MDHDRCRSASLILLRMAGLPVKQLNHWNLWMKSRETYTKAHHHCYKSGGNGTRTILGNDINHPIIVRTYTGTCPIRALTLKWTLESTGILRISAQHAPTFFVSRLQEREREVWKNMENRWCCWWTKNIQSPVCFRRFLTKHVLKLSRLWRRKLCSTEVNSTLSLEQEATNFISQQSQHKTITSEHKISCTSTASS